MKDYDKNKESSYVKYWNINNLYGCEMSQKLPVNNFKWVNDISNFDESLEKVIMKKVMKDISLKSISSTWKIYTTFTMIYHFYLKE